MVRTHSETPLEIFSIREWQCAVRSNRNVATFVKELVLEPPEGESVPFRAGGYVQVKCPPQMLQVCMAMLADLGVERENILFDDFG
jgi:Na+-transporting NADH:ubiquinone oxidoreductase subunit F